MMAKEHFAKMDQHLDLFTRKGKLMSWSMRYLTAAYREILDQLTAGSSKILDGVQWSLTSTHLYWQDLICVLKDYKETMLEWAQNNGWSPWGEETSLVLPEVFSSLRVGILLSRRFYVRSSLSVFALRLKVTLQRSAVEVKNLPIRNQINSILYVEFMELPRFACHDFALLVADGVSRYS